MNENVSHQHEAEKNKVPKSHPKINDLTADSFSRSIAKNKGTSANHAQNHRSKFGKASVRRIAERTAKSEFAKVGNLDLAKENLITDSLSKKADAKNRLIFIQTD